MQTTSRSSREVDGQLSLLPRPQYAWRLIAKGRRTQLVLMLQSQEDRSDADVIRQMTSAAADRGIVLEPVWPGDLVDLTPAA
jgi:hypothetical protein